MRATPDLADFLASAIIDGSPRSPTATLRDLGIYYATDLDGGYGAWKAAGLPTG